LLWAGPIYIGVPILVATYASFPLTLLFYRLIFLPAMILMLGGHYIYAEVPPRLLMGACSGSPGTTTTAWAPLRPGLRARDPHPRDLLRRAGVTGRGWLFFLDTCVCLAFSPFYELVEWWRAELTGSAVMTRRATPGTRPGTFSKPSWAR
jgi:putative membrane protein